MDLYLRMTGEATDCANIPRAPCLQSCIILPHHCPDEIGSAAGQSFDYLFIWDQGLAHNAVEAGGRGRTLFGERGASLLSGGDTPEDRIRRRKSGSWRTYRGGSMATESGEADFC